ncbi:MAG: phosphoadenosine phosphosulfate reductase family protein, partial [Zoogloea sp.]|nr:phosphoadenosine phosphosulfate reductase family protein [Zoogloea sp.]
MHPNQNPKLDNPALLASLEGKTAQLKADLAAWAAELPAITMANSLGAEDMVLTDVIATAGLPIEIFSLDTGRLPLETYDLMARVQQHYGLKLKFFYPQHGAIEAFTREHGINAFYDSVELRKACCHARKVEPLGRALGGKQAWITGLRAEQSTT